MDCKYCGCPMIMDDYEIHALSGSWHLQYCLSFWICQECGAVAIVDSSINDIWAERVEWSEGEEDETETPDRP